MSRTDVEPRPFTPGTTGWTAADLEDPAVEREWFRGRYEIIEGVLTIMPPAYFVGGRSLQRLIRLLTDYFEGAGIIGEFATEVDMIVAEDRVPVADAVFLTREDAATQEAAVAAAAKPDPDRVRILVPPMLVIESVSPGHERHDRKTKRAWYAEFGVRHYLILDAFARTLEWLRLEGSSYVAEPVNGTDGSLTPSSFPGLVIPLERLWAPL